MLSKEDYIYVSIRMVILLNNFYKNTHTRGVNPTEQPPRSTSSVTLMPAILWVSNLIIQKVLGEKMFIYSVLESSRDKLQDYAEIYRVFHLRNSKWPSRNLYVILQGQTNGTILCPPRNRITFVWNIYHE